MLVLNQSESDAITLTIPAGTVISKDMEITVKTLQVKGKQVSLAFLAPQVVEILRDNAIKKVKESA